MKSAELMGISGYETNAFSFISHLLSSQTLLPAEMSECKAVTITDYDRTQ